MKKIILTSLLVAGFAGTLSAQTVYEGFNYSGSNFADDTGTGTGLSGNWTFTGGSGDVVAGFSATSLASSANPFTTSGGSALTRNIAGMAVRSLSSSISMDLAGTNYFSYVFNAAQLQSTYLNFRGSSAGDDMLVGLKNEGGTPTARSLIGGGTQDLGITLSTTTTYFVVGKITSVASGNDSISASFFTTTPGATEPVSWDVTSSAAVTGSITGIGLNADAAGDPQAIFDEIRIGTTYGSVAVVPEPSTYALLAGCLALASVMVRRRRS